ncbi:hypothetical protein [Gottfriedia solisilvae]|uniref:Uncharacterized protein n=1 Tax=Gottfriedia solisilvae TaxID=1516104 RepID=A0A8J3EX66_9BACI|nr:hypothetical protein [Gottfriedia solisilvae]GGI11619.1 hypothetical protein GCM10007380_08750 [Gottfriedia solisilvae]
MWVGATLIFLFIGLISITQIILNRKWELIYTAYGYEDYFKFISKLKSEGVKYKVELPVNARSDRFNDNTQYDIYVKKI